jgi:PAS domain S-box-containing protein
MKLLHDLQDYFHRFRTLFISRTIPTVAMEEDSLTFWRVNVLFAVLFTALVLGTFAVIAGISLVIKEKVWGLAILNILGYVMCIWVLFSRRLSYKFRAKVSLLMFYFVGSGVILLLGPLSGGPIWLFTFAVLAGVLLGLRTAIMAITLNGITLIVFAGLLQFGQFGQAFPFFNTWQAGLAAIINFIILNVIAAISVSILLKGIISTYQKEKDLLRSLEKEKTHLMGTKKRLELEIVEREQVQEALRESEEKFRLISEQSLMSIVIVQDDRIKYANQAYFLITGYTWEEIKNWTMADAAILIHPDDRQFVIEQGRKKAAGIRDGIVTHYAYRGLNKRGEIRWINQYSKTITYGGKPADLMTFIDIHEQRLAQETLIQSEKRYRELADSLPQIVFETDDALKLTFVNRNAFDIFGYSRQDLERGMHPLEMLIPEDRNRAKENIERVMRGEGLDGNEYTALRKDGSTFPISIHSNALIRENKPPGIRGIIIDLTQIKVAEAALRESEETYRNILESIEDAYFEVDVAGNLTFFNDSLCKLIGYRTDKLMGMNYRRYTDKGNVEALYETFNHVYTTGKPDKGFDWEIIRKDGGKRYVETSVSLRKDSEGKAIGFRGIARDVTERRHAEVALLHSEERYRSLVENTLDGYFICEIPSGRFLFLNRSSCNMYGYTMQEGLSLTIWDVISTEEHDVIHRRVQARQEGNKVSSGSEKYTAVHKNGSTFRVEISTSLITFQGRPVVQGILRDITEKESLEQQLQKAEKLEAIGTLAGGIAHDFNNLLMAIQGRASLMTMSRDPSHSDFEHLGEINKYVKKAASLTRQLLGFARSGKYEVKPTDINDLIVKISSMFGRTKKEILIHSKYAEGIWTLDVDRDQIGRVFMNLFVNAWQAMAGGGDLFLETENVTLSGKYLAQLSIKPGRYVKISITDTGIGMDRKTQERIFDPFFTTKDVGRGTGLGLASAYGIIQNHGGFINVYSEKGEGSTFKIYLPASGSNVDGQESENIEDVKRGHETLLFVDDEEMIIEVGEALLLEMGYKVLIAKDGKQALELFEKHKDRIGLVILDMIMPGMNGGETFDRLKKIDPHVKVILSSGYSMNGQASEIFNRGCAGFIQKPFDVIEFSLKLREILDGT